MERAAQTIGELVQQVATLERAASWMAAHGSDEEVITAAASLCGLTGNLAERLRSDGLSAAETPAHRATLVRLPDAAGHSALVTEIHRPARARSGEDPPAAPGGDDGDGRGRGHHRLCPLGAGQTRWYVCPAHDPKVIFQAGSGYLDAVANSCPRCARLGRSYLGCACEEAERPVDRETREGRRVVRAREAGEESEPGDESGEADA